MRKLFTALALASQLLGATAAHATVNWQWSFAESTVNLALGTSVNVTLTNLATSDESIVGARIDFSSFGTFGVLEDPISGNHITPSLMALPSTLAPGQSVTFEAMRFFLSGPTNNGLPSPSFSQTIAPSMFVRGSLCNSPFDCSPSKAGDNTLTLVYAPVPEASTWALWMVGLAGFAAFGRRRWGASRG